mmetsp:Transcript_105662/g.340781  ORF Transcript_105662/g.340781 Transcript_105662/m.340781 type:complete len:337 (-) Transcript_105662:37-1047(-)
MDRALMWRCIFFGAASCAVRAGRTLVSGATVMTPGESTSHLTFAMSPSTHWMMPANHWPSYSTSTRSPVDTCGLDALKPSRLLGWVPVRRAKCCVGSKASQVLASANSTEGHWATTTACEDSRCTRKIAGSGWPIAAETTSAPTTSQASARPCTSASSTRPRFRQAASKPTISACSSRGTESRRLAAEPPESCHAAMRCRSTRRPPTSTSPSLPPHSKTTWRVRSTLSASHCSRDCSSKFCGSVAPLPAWTLLGTKQASATPKAWRRSRSCWTSSRTRCICAHRAAASSRLPARRERTSSWAALAASPTSAQSLSAAVARMALRWMRALRTKAAAG